MNDASVRQPEVIVQPPAGAWSAPGDWRDWWSLSEDARRCRQQLGLPIDRPVIASGHQAAFWHAGILAKHLAMTGFAAPRGWGCAWVVVDQDPEEFAGVRVPVRAGGGEPLKVETVPIAPEGVAQALKAGVPPCVIPPFDPVQIADREWATPSVGEGLRSIVAALKAAKSGARSAAEQVARAASSLVPGGDRGVVSVMATSLAQTDVFASLIERMRADPAACASAYNAAVEALPGAKLTALGIDAARGRWEMPLWAIDAETGVRRRVWSDLLGDVRGLRLAPRALMLTAVLRLAACDVFVHGLGGGASAVEGQQQAPSQHAASGARDFGGYDRATELWVRSWLGRELCPSVVVSATLRLPLVRGEVVTAEQVARARWLAHAASHNPGLAGDAAGQRRKLELVGSIEGAADRSGRLAQYRALHAELDRVKGTLTGEAQRLSARAGAMQRRFAEQVVAMDRTWAFPLHSAEGLALLHAAVERVVK